MNNNVNNTANKLANTIRSIQNSYKTKIGFVVIIFIFLLIILILIIKKTINSNRMRNRLLKNTFFTEMEKGLEPYNAWCSNAAVTSNPIPDYLTYESKTYIYDTSTTDWKLPNPNLNNSVIIKQSNGKYMLSKTITPTISNPNLIYESKTYIYHTSTTDWKLPSPNPNNSVIKQLSNRKYMLNKNITLKLPIKTSIKNKCKELCIYDKKGYKSIPSTITNLSNQRHYTMFWFKINKIPSGTNNPFDSNSTTSLSLDYPLIYFARNIIIPNYDKNDSFGFYIKPINNSLTVKKDNEVISRINNLPYGEWTCLSYLKSNSSIDIYINGKLLKTIPIDNNNYNNIFTKPLRWGPYPGNLAFLELNKDPDELNPQSILDSYKYYKNLINNYKNDIDNKIAIDIYTSSELSKLLETGKINSNLVCIT